MKIQYQCVKCGRNDWTVSGGHAWCRECGYHFNWLDYITAEQMGRPKDEELKVDRDWQSGKPHTCPVCKKALNVSSTGVIFIE